MPQDFPTVLWGTRAVTFRPRNESAPRPASCHAALVFAFRDDQIVLADIAGRGWCVPSGRLEPGESARDAALREAYEEAGLALTALTLLGDTIFHPLDGTPPTIAANYIAHVERFHPIPPASESLGILLSSREELSDRYYLWDELIESIFDYAWERRV